MLSALNTRLSTQESVDALRRQLHLDPVALRPGMLPLQRDVRWIADKILEKLTPLAGYPRDQLAIETLHHRLSNGPPSLEVSVEALPDLYAFFKKAEHVLSRHRSRQNPEMEADYTLCRALKWQFRAAVSEGNHQRLTHNLLQSLSYIRDGGERINHRHIGYDIALESTRQISAGPHLAADSRLATTADQRIKSTRIIALQGKLKSTLSQPSESRSRAQLGLGYVSSREYSSLEHYADARSHSVRTSLSESIGRTANNLRNLVSDSCNLQRHCAYSAQSQPYVRDTLARAGLVDVELPCLHPPSQPVMTERGIALTMRGKVAVDFFNFLNVHTTIELTLQRTRQHKALDILGLHEMSTVLAKQQLVSLKRPDDSPTALLNDMKNHVISSSRQFTRSVSKPVPASKLNAALHTSNRQARSLLERYVLLKTDSRLDTHLDREIRALIQRNPVLLRPEALRTYTLTAQAQTLSGSAGVTASSRAEAGGKGVSIEFSHRKSDDPHLSGDYLTIDIAALKSVAVVQKTLRHALSSIGDQAFDWEKLVRSISESLLDPARPSSTHVLVKIKHGEPVVLLTRHTMNKQRNLGLPKPVERFSGIDVQSLRTRQTLRTEQLGTDSLDHVLPIARRYLGNPDEKPGWDNYVQRHADDFHALLNALGRPSHGTTLAADLDAIKRISPALERAAEDLTRRANAALEAPTADHRASAREAFNHLLREYLPHYEAKVSQAWTLS
ncbi:hypothetical protein [Pseudomonas sp. JAI120]|uniref:hypothetical protein n=1 Tax=Pseudomonas sp. JAI120 TaxID=2723063 RepID=UPI0030EE4FD0